MKRSSFYIFVLALALGGYAWVMWTVLAGGGSTPAVPDVCLFRTITHLPCPSCGTTRAISDLLHGDLRASLLTNPFGMIDMLALLILPLWSLGDLIRRKESLYCCYRRWESYIIGRRWLVSAAVVLVALNWIWNIRKGL